MTLNAKSGEEKMRENIGFNYTRKQLTCNRNPKIRDHK